MTDALAAMRTDYNSYLTSIQPVRLLAHRRRHEKAASSRASHDAEMYVMVGSVFSSSKGHTLSGLDDLLDR